MKFLQYQGKDGWWKWPEDGMTVYNINGGHHEIDENSEEFMCGKVVSAENWHELCVTQNYNPWKTETLKPHMWIAPDGTMYDIEEWGAHECIAEDIWEYILGRPERDFYDYGDALIQEGWIKVTTSGMYFYYAERGFYDVMSEEQWFVYQEWKKKYFGDKY